MERKFLLRGYKEFADLPVFFDKNEYSLEEAINKAKEYLKKNALLSKIIIFRQEEGDGKKAVRLLFRKS